MNRILVFCTIIVAASHVMSAQTDPGLSLSRKDALVCLDGRLDLSAYKPGSGESIILSPVLKNGTDSLSFSPVGIYSRNQWYYAVRNGEIEGKALRNGKGGNAYQYSDSAPYAAWMDGAQLVLYKKTQGCCGQVKSLSCTPLLTWEENPQPQAEPFVFKPVFKYVRPEAEARKMRSVSGTAMIDFPVGSSAVQPDYRNNASELTKIRSTFESIKRDKALTITQIFIKGFASPDGPYHINERLAQGRTQSIRDYIAGLYSLPGNLCITESVAEDWDGLRESVAGSGYSDKDALLEIMDSGREPDTREWLMKTSHKESYADLLENVLPSLRRTEYRVDYAVPHFETPEEILAQMDNDPRNLSLEEFFVAAGQYEPGSEEYCTIFEKALKYFPGDATANLNAANAEMAAGLMDKAADHLEKAGTSAEADYARGNWMAIEGRSEEAAAFFRKAAEAGIPEAADALGRLKQ